MDVMNSMANGRMKKTLAHQLDRFDGILDGLADALNESVADAVRASVADAVRAAVSASIAEAVTVAVTVAVREVLARHPAPVPPPVPVAADAPKRGFLSRFRDGVSQLAAVVMAPVSSVARPLFDRVSGPAAARLAPVKRAASRFRSRTLRVAAIGYWLARGLFGLAGQNRTAGLGGVAAGVVTAATCYFGPGFLAPTLGGFAAAIVATLAIATAPLWLDEMNARRSPTA